ncbi:MAG TPA: ABC transporter permease [Dehalococcoidales bacterium]|nr:ABC transporter permease [Dehalococcoidales bacterium]
MTSYTRNIGDIRKAVLPVGERPKQLSPLASLLTFSWRAILKIKHVPEQLIDVTASPIIFLLMFTYLFGGAIAGSTAIYLQYLLPGILVMSVIFITIYTGVGLNNDIKKGVFDRFRSLPMWRPSVIVGALLADIGRYTVASLVVILLGVVLGFRPEGGVTGVFFSLLLLVVFSSSLSWLWITLGLLMRTPESLMAVSMMILMPLTFASNVFVVPETMPWWLEAFVNINPVTYLVTAVRGLMSGTVDAGDIVWVLIASAVLFTVFSPLAMYVYRKKQ